MHIVIDAGLSELTPAGVARYSNNLYSGLRMHFQLLPGAGSVELTSHNGLRRIPFPVLRRLAYIFAINVGKSMYPVGSIVHFTNHYVPLTRRENCKYVVTFHDMAAWTIPENFRHEYLAFIRPIMRKAAQVADLIITVSQTVRQEIIDALGLPDNRVRICPNAVAPIFRRVEGMQKGNHILFVGNIDRHKNLPTLVEAFARLRRRNSITGLRLVVVGARRGGMREFSEAIRSHGLNPEIVLFGRASDEELVRLYNSAWMLVMPSVYEGFGIPVVEAMACGTPVVASDIPVFREIAGEAALFYGPPRDAERLAETIERVFVDESLRERMAGLGLTHSARYSMFRFVDAHVEAYRAV